MNKMIRKLLAAIMALVLTVVMVVTVSYAWYTLSDSPVAEGIQITIGGGSTILIAADYSQTVDGITYHYPGNFDGTMVFSQYEQYDYLDQVAGLTPVSTADGVHWFLPESYDYADTAVINGEAVVGQMKPITEFFCDTDLAYANLTADQSELAQKGSYGYLDFWVVSPSADYTLRVSTGEENGGSGSFLMEMKTPVQGEDGKYTLVETEGHAAASARVGFLICQDNIMDETYDYYKASPFYDSKYDTLRGMYQQPGEGPMYTSGYRFTIYEPNADRHPLGEHGDYYITRPIGYKGGTVAYADLDNMLMPQLSGKWKVEGETDGITLDAAFNTWQFGQKDVEQRTVEEVKQLFYNQYVQKHLLPYVRLGQFVKRTGNLYAYARGNQTDIIPSEELAKWVDGATDDTYIVQLEKNVPQRIRMFIWLEGQDVDCVNLNQVLDIALSIELAGGSR